MPIKKPKPELRDYVAIIRHGDTASVYYFKQTTKRELMAQIVKQDLFGEGLTSITIDEPKQYDAGVVYITSAHD